MEGEEDQALNQYFDENGYSTKVLIKNLGSTFVYMVIYCLLLLMIPILKFMSNIFPKLSKAHMWLKQKMLWNATISFILQQYPALILSSGINLYGLSFKNRDSGKIASSVISLILMIGCIIVIPIFFFIIRNIKTKKMS